MKSARLIPDKRWDEDLEFSAEEYSDVVYEIPSSWGKMLFLASEDAVLGRNRMLVPS